MAVMTGKNGTAFLGAAELVPLVRWRLMTRVQTADYAANDTGGWRRRAAGPRECSGRFELKADTAGRCPVEEGDAVTLRLHLDDLGENYYEVPALVESIAMDLDVGRATIIGWTISFVGAGAVVRHGITAKP